MGTRWWLMMVGVCAVVATAHSAAVPTQDTMVVARSDETSTAAVAKDESVTEEPLLPLKLTEMEVKSEVFMRYANTAVVTRVRNPARRAQEATFRVLLPETAFISGFTMILDGKPYKAYVKEKDEAKKIYNEAVSQGIGAAHVATKARDSNHFTVSVNVEANTTAVFNLTYEELLVRRNGVYNLAMNLHPGALVPKLTVTVHLKETKKITELRVPEIRTGNEIDATKDDKQNANAVIVKSNGDREATITFTPDLQEQKRLMEIYAEKSKESSSRVNSGYGPYYGAQEQESPEGVLGQFVVQYDVDHANDGEILVNNGYFVHFFAPSELPPLRKHVVFVLDTSGSMMERKIEQLREAMQTILTELNPGDYFNIVTFASNVQILDLNKDPSQEPRPAYSYYERPAATAPVPPAPATPENIAKAKTIVRGLLAAGGTNIGDAFDVAVGIIQKGIEGHAKKGASGNETTNDTTVVKPEDNKTTKKDESVKVEPIIIFLTDGEPTVGETSPKRLINRITEKNYGDSKATIFTLAFGEDADREFLRKLSLRNEGFMRHIYEASDSALQLRDFYRQISSPLLAHVKFTYPPEQVKQSSVTKSKFRTYYLGSELVVAGELADRHAELTPSVHYWCGNIDFEPGFHDIRPRPPVELKREEYLPLERLWAYITIKQLLDERDAAEEADKPKDEENGPEKKALALALKYEFVTPLTSLVVVKPNATNAVDAESVDKSDEPPFGRPLAHMNILAGAPGVPAQAYGAAFASMPFSLSAPTIVQPGASAIASPEALGLPADSALFEESEDYEIADAINKNAEPMVFSPLMQSLTTALINTQIGGALHSYPSTYSAGGASRFYQSASSGSMWGSAADLRDSVDIRKSYILPAVSDYDEVVIYSDHSQVLTTPLSLPLPTSEEPPRALQPYHLDSYRWVEPLLNTTTDTILLHVNDSVVTLRVTKDDSAPKATDGDAECAVATDGASGACVYLTRCAAARDIDVSTYTSTYCSINNGYAGVCCPKSSVDAQATH